VSRDTDEDSYHGGTIGEQEMAPSAAGVSSGIVTWVWVDSCASVLESDEEGYCGGL
jgi:hypothetical protein